MRRTSQTIAALGLLACATTVVMPLGCGGIAQAPTRVQYLTNARRLPLITEERLVGCMKEYANQLPGRYYRVQANVPVDEDGRKGTVTVGRIPDSAPDFAACVRITLRDMAVPGWVFKLRPDTLPASTNERRIPTGNAIANPIVVGVLILFGELVVEYGGYTILFAITVQLGNAAVRDIAEALKDAKDIRRQCNDKRTDCLETSIASGRGPKWGHSRCEGCYDVCMQDRGLWPSLIELGGRIVACE